MHLIRELKYLADLYKIAWPVRFRVVLMEADRLKKRLPPSGYLNTNHERSWLEKNLLDLLEEPIDPQHKELVAFQKRMIRYKRHLFTFLDDPAAPSHNNDSEQAIRNVKVKQKISGQFKAMIAAENFAVLRSIIETAIKNDQNVLPAMNVIAHYHRD